MGRIGMNDLISRQAVIAFLQSIPYIKEHLNMGELMKEWIEQIPSVQPKTGRWIDIMVEGMPAQACDQCNTFYPLAYTGGGHKYCPNCGAKMEE